MPTPQMVAARGRRADPDPGGLPHPVTRYENQTPNAPSSSSTALPKMYRKKMLLLRCCHEAWQNVQVRNCHHCGAWWFR